MKTSQILRTLVLLSLATCDLTPATSFAQSTAFTYQGHLNAGGGPANGNYDFQFKLYDDPYAGTQIGTAQLTNALPVSAGLFITTIDFGAGVFTGSNYWLEIAVQTNGGGSFSALTPRQQLTPTPYAIYANTASNLSGTLPVAQLAGTVGNDRLANNSITVTAGTGLGGGGVVALGGTTTLNNAGVVSVTGNADITASTLNGAVILGDTATNANTPNTIIKRDASGDFSAGSIALDGNINLPTTTGNAGVINAGGNRLLHTYGMANTFVGQNAGNFATNGSFNTANGNFALNNNIGSANTANGALALQYNTGGSQNTADGAAALYKNSSGSGNTANGYQALNLNLSGYYNIALGYYAGSLITNGNYNIEIGNTGFGGDSQIIRIGTQGTQTNTYIAGIYGATAASGVAVYVNSSGQLGTLTSSQKYKQDIRDMNDTSAALLSLHPVMFKYKPELDPKGLPQFGLVAEKVEKINPALVAHDEQGRPYTFRYEAVNAMLLNEFLKEHKTVESQSAEILDLKQNVAELKALVERRAGK